MSEKEEFVYEKSGPLISHGYPGQIGEFEDKAFFLGRVKNLDTKDLDYDIEAFLSSERVRKNWRKCFQLVRSNKAIQNMQNELTNAFNNSSSTEYGYKPKQQQKSNTIWLEICWGLGLLIAVLYYGIIVPFRVSFDMHSSTWLGLDLTLDILIALIVVIAYYTRIKAAKMLPNYQVHGAVAFILKDISFYHAVVCFLVCMPWETIGGDAIVVKLVHFINAAFYRKFTIAQPHTVHERRGFFRNFHNMSWLLWTLLLIPFYAHILTCIWLNIGLAANKNNGPDSWVNRFDPSKGSAQVIFDIYLEGYFFMYQTLSTAGYGTTIPTTISELFVVMCLATLSEYFLLSMYLSIQRVIHKLYFEQLYFQNRIERINHWIYGLKNIPQTLNPTKLSVILNKCANILKTDSVPESFTQNELYLQLPLDIKRRLVLHTFKERYNQFKEFYDSLSEESATALLLEMTPIIAYEEEFLYQDSQSVDEIYFIASGELGEIRMSDTTICNYFSKGSIIGFRELINHQELPRNFIAISRVDGFHISKKKFIEIIRMKISDHKYVKKMALHEITQIGLPSRTQFAMKGKQNRRVSKKLLEAPNFKRTSSTSKVMPLPMNNESNLEEKKLFNSEENSITIHNIVWMRDTLNSPEPLFRVGLQKFIFPPSPNDSQIHFSDLRESNIFHRKFISHLRNRITLPWEEDSPAKSKSLKESWFGREDPVLLTPVLKSGLSDVMRSQADSELLELEEQLASARPPKMRSIFLEGKKTDEKVDSENEEDELNSSLEIPVEGILAKDMMMRSNLFTLEEIADGLHVKLIEHKARLNRLKDKIVSQAAKTKKLIKSYKLHQNSVNARRNISISVNV